MTLLKFFYLLFLDVTVAEERKHPEPPAHVENVHDQKHHKPHHK